MLLKPMYHFCHAALERALLTDRSKVTNHLATQRGRHLTKRCLSFRRIAKGENESRRKIRLARVFIAFDGDFHNSAGVNAQLLSYVAMDGHAIAAFSSGDQRRLDWNTFHFPANWHVGSAIAESARDVGRNIDKANDSDFVDFGGEDLNAVHFAEMIMHRTRLWANGYMQCDGAKGHKLNADLPITDLLQQGDEFVRAKKPRH